ncbi:MAG: hypothetical protein FWB91_13705 [Defluviitaleaceae bacterium]|nr:hypothetical protein [Defluviitaleaceae bacterium]MCL2218057.1 hypothetical protein [Defluviitaleaceae bacterium]
MAYKRMIPTVDPDAYYKKQKILALMPGAFAVLLKGHYSYVKPTYYNNLFKDYVCSNHETRKAILSESILKHFCQENDDVYDVEMAFKANKINVIVLADRVVEMLCDSIKFSPLLTADDRKTLKATGYSTEKVHAFNKLLCCASVGKALAQVFKNNILAVAGLQGEFDDPFVQEVSNAQHIVRSISL